MVQAASIADFRARARRRIPRAIFDYASGGSAPNDLAASRAISTPLLCASGDGRCFEPHPLASAMVPASRVSLPLAIAPTGPPP